MRPTPPGWPRIAPALYYANAKAMIPWLCQAFGFNVRLLVEDAGRVKHAELAFADSLIMVADEKSDQPHHRAPTSVGGANTQNLMLFVDDVDAHCAHARASGAVIVSEPVTHDYGEAFWTDRSYECRDPGGHHWWFTQRLRSAAPKPG